MKNDIEFMKLALDLAATAKGKTNPNPLVGAVISQRWDDCRIRTPS